MKPVARSVFRGILALGLVYAGWLAVRSAITRSLCGQEETRKVEELSGLRFEVTYLSCDTFAKDEAIRVYVDRVASDKFWSLARWRHKRTLLFRYDPSAENSPLPAVTRPSPSTILISIPEVSSIAYQNRKWENLTVDYKLGRVDYPLPTPKSP